MRKRRINGDQGTDCRTQRIPNAFPIGTVEAAAPFDKESPSTHGTDRENVDGDMRLTLRRDSTDAFTFLARESLSVARTFRPEGSEQKQK